VSQGEQDIGTTSPSTEIVVEGSSTIQGDEGKLNLFAGTDGEYTIVGTSGDDVIDGDEIDDSILGGAGDDKLGQALDAAVQQGGATASKGADVKPELGGEQIAGLTEVDEPTM